MRKIFKRGIYSKSFLFLSLLLIVLCFSFLPKGLVNASLIESKDILRIETNLNIWREAPPQTQSFLSQTKLTALDKFSMGQISRDQQYVKNEILIKYKKSAINFLDTNSKTAENNFLKSKSLALCMTTVPTICH